MGQQTRMEWFLKQFPREPRFRFEQIVHALFDESITSWESVTTLPKRIRNVFVSEVPWISVLPIAVLESRDKKTQKAILAFADGKRIETVLMKNARGHWSVCVSSQVGCAMGCTFCATGNMGFSRNLTSDEIIDQVRFWRYLLSAEAVESKTDVPIISNVVFMGMGEPLANYDAVAESLRVLLASTEIGPTRITVSTVGMLPALWKLLEDPLWPPVRLAISLHSADPDLRRKLMPSSADLFLEKLAVWAEAYFLKFDERRRHLTFEYILLRGINDRRKDAEKLIRFVHRVGKVKVNLIPYNETDRGFLSTDKLRIDRFFTTLDQAGVTVTKRKPMGQDIAAACGQLVVLKQSP